MWTNCLSYLSEQFVDKQETAQTPIRMFSSGGMVVNFAVIHYFLIDCKWKGVIEYILDSIV